ncbi:MAG: hypothetical protein WCR21_13750, partial [Bacteroidota bacterium]
MKKQRVLFGLTFMLFCFVNSFAQYKQELKTEKDPFTNEKVVSANYINKYTSGKMVLLENKSGKTKFGFEWSYPGSFNTLIEKGAEIMLKLADGEVLKLTTTEDARPKLTAGIGGVFTAYMFEMEIEKVTLNKLSLQKIIMLRVPDLK